MKLLLELSPIYYLVVGLKFQSLLIFKDDNLALPNIGYLDRYHMAEDEKKELEKKWKKFEHEEMKEEAHQIDLKEGYEQDEEYEESDD